MTMFLLLLHAPKKVENRQTPRYWKKHTLNSGMNLPSPHLRSVRQFERDNA